MDVQVVTAAVCAAVAFALLLQQFLLIAAIKRLLAEERKKNAETMVQALRSLESSFADRMRHLAARIEQVEVGLDAIGRHHTGLAERSTPSQAAHRRATEAIGWVNASNRDLRGMDAEASRDEDMAPLHSMVGMGRHRLHTTSACKISRRSRSSPDGRKNHAA